MKVDLRDELLLLDALLVALLDVLLVALLVPWAGLMVASLVGL